MFSDKFQNLFENLYKSFKTSVLKVTTHFLFYNVIIQHYFFFARILLVYLFFFAIHLLRQQKTTC
ncbi:hypothetical protein AKK44_01060 [Streptococcus phocae]|uniref:Uncharacterized protein n=1 Tax=Streptococcus phocae TaxID=119224 RepID=A0A0P6S9D7_9STRE|nr:hypothetical protein AKK44_01060 [Streptococcus phocae]